MFFLPTLASDSFTHKIDFHLRQLQVSSRRNRLRPPEGPFFRQHPSKFFIFFPRDWHIAKVANDTSDQAIRVIVVKVDYVE